MRAFLMLQAAVWLSYGVYCFVAPESLGGAAGVAISSPTGSVELRAMYGGLQIALGVLCLLASRRATLTRAALTTLAFLATGLGSARLLGMALDGGLSTYTLCALAFEWGTLGGAVACLRAG